MNSEQVALKGDGSSVVLWVDGDQRDRSTVRIVFTELLTNVL